MYHVNEDLICNFWDHYNEYATINKNVLDLIKRLKNNRYNLIPNECLFVDDKKDNVDTVNKLGILGKNVQLDNYESIIELLEEYGINFC